MTPTTEAETELPVRERARPMAPEERRRALVQCVIPLLAEHGRDVSTRQIAEACGVAEGTVFRAFGDKESLIAAAVEAYFDPEPFRAALAAVDHALPPEEKIRQVFILLRERFTGVMGFMSALRMQGGPPPSIRRADSGWMAVLEALLEPDRAALAVPPRTIARYLRLLALSSAIPHLHGDRGLEPDEIVHLIQHGVLLPDTEED
ncbi:TetR/AcrR family transcriptional regulator [uncultured Amnibacterium sp.]|uniref:TetR/AcrR family transcriptional regulator n=1 Tax=uncultured Amnibacterium sp. TaxID=1631851 RepID=UPI0035C9AF99